MNPNTSDHRRSPAAARSWLGLACLAACVLTTGCGSVVGSRNDSYELLRAVPVPVSDVAVSSPGALDLEEGQILKQQTYTLDRDGEFTLNRLIESEVGTVRASFDTLSPSRAKRLDMEPFSGVYVRSVRSKGPFRRAGIRSRDAILSFAGETVTSRDQLTHLIESAEPGTAVQVEYNHGGEISVAAVEIASETRTESVRVLHRQLPVLDDRARTGLRIVEVPEDIHSLVRGKEMREGALLISEMLPGGPAFFSDLRVRDVITYVGDEPVSTHGDYSVALDEYRSGRPVGFTADRDGRLVHTSVTIEDDATSSSGFNLLSLVKYRNEPEEREFSMIWEILLHTGKGYSVEKKGNVARHTTSVSWGAFLDLLRYHRTPKKTKFTFLWILPITFRHDETS